MVVADSADKRAMDELAIAGHKTVRLDSLERSAVAEIIDNLNESDVKQQRKRNRKKKMAQLSKSVNEGERILELTQTRFWSSHVYEKIFIILSTINREEVCFFSEVFFSNHKIFVSSSLS